MNHGGTEARSGSAGLEEEPLTREIIGGAILVHKELGPGLLESAYEECLAVELEERGLQVQRQIPLPVVFKGRRIECGYRMDMLVNDTVVVEIQAVERMIPVHEAQLLTYLRLARKSVGLLMNFHVPYLRGGVMRRVL